MSNDENNDKAFQRVAEAMLAADGAKAGTFMAMATNAMVTMQVGNVSITVGNN